MNLPRARTADIVEAEANSELMIYDLRINKAYVLNETSKIVYQACGNNQSSDDLKREYRYTDDLIYLTLDELQVADLIEGEIGNHFVGMTRREVVRRVGLASMAALPIVTGLIAPNASQAASACRTAGQSCTFIDYRQSNCCTNLRCYETSTCNTCNPQGSSTFCTGIGCCLTQGGNACCGNYTESAGNGAQRICTCN